MSFKIWLTTKAGAQTNPQPGEKEKLYGATVETSKESGGKYISLYLDPIDPNVDMPRFEHKHIKAVTFSDKYHEGFRPEGMYRHKGGRAMVRTKVDVHNPYCGNQQDTTSIERYQVISISAKSIKTVREIYTLIRQGKGKLEPTEHWSDGGKEGVEILERDMM